MESNMISNVSSKPVSYSYEKAAMRDAKTAAESATDAGAVYEKAADTGKATYSVAKMSEEERSALVSQLKADQQSRQDQLASIVEKMIQGQAGSSLLASGDEDAIWKFLAKGDFKNVDEAAVAQAKEDIAEGGYYSVENTSQRLFDFAMALAGDDVSKMEKMQKAMQKGFDQATKAWGQDLPDISQKTLEAANKLFDDYYESKNA